MTEGSACPACGYAARAIQARPQVLAPPGRSGRKGLWTAAGAGLILMIAALILYDVRRWPGPPAPASPVGTGATTATAARPAAAATHARTPALPGPAAPSG